MGIELKLEVSAEQVKSFYTNPDLRQSVVEALSFRSQSQKELSPGLYAYPLQFLDYLHRAELAKVLDIDAEALGKDIKDAENTYQKLLNSFNSKKLEELEGLVEEHFSQLRAFEKLYLRLSGFDRKNLPDEEQRHFETAMGGLRRILITSNTMYNPATSIKFLGQVEMGTIRKHNYQMHLFSPFEPKNPPKTL